MTDAKRILKQIDVAFISLVNKGANQKTIIFKSAAAPATPEHTKNFSIAKMDDDQRLVYGIVYSPDEVDSQGDTANATVIKDMAHRFMETLKGTNIDKQHDFVAGQGYVAESWITRKNDALFGADPVGSWAVAIKVQNDETWAAIKSGDIQGLSLAGTALGEVVNKAAADEPRGIINTVRKFFRLDVAKDFNEELAETQTRQMVDVLMDALTEALSDDTITDKKAAMLASIGQFTTAINGAVKADTTLDIAKVGKTLSAKNLAALKGAMENLMSIINAAESADTTKAEDNMTQEEITKAVGDAVAAAIAPITAKLEKAEADNTALLAQVDALEKATPGSAQIHKNDDGQKPVRFWL